MVTAPDGAPWWVDAVVYQVYPRSFSDADGDGMGDLRGVLARLDHLAWLGVDILWLSPVYRSPQHDNGYDISDYRAIDPVFGTLADLDELLAAVHARGMKLVMDLVVNHTSDEHPWFVESRASRDNPRRDWYWWHPPSPGTAGGAAGAEPNAWRSFFSGPAWTLDERTGEYYLHLFARQQPDLNWEHPEVRAEIHAMMRWWLDRGVDGFRMDVINLISKDPTLADGRSVHDGPRIHEFLAEMHREVFAGRDPAPFTVGETPGTTVEEARRYSDPARRELDMVFQFEHMDVDRGSSKFDLRPLRLSALKSVLGRWQEGLEDVGWNSLYLGNHDQPRMVSRFGDDGEHRVASATMLATVLHLHRGTPFIYQGDEIGMTNARFESIADFLDVETANFFAAEVAAGADPDKVLARLRPASRANARSPMQWEAGHAAGFTSGTPWMSVNPNAREINVAAARADPGSVLHYYRRLIDLRHRLPVLAQGDFTMLLPDDESVYAYTRRLGDDEVLVVGNWSGDPAPVPIEGWAGAELVLGNLPEPPARVTDPLRPWEARVYVRRSSRAERNSTMWSSAE